MRLLAPTALLFGLLVIPILVLYLLKLRRREVEISSTLLWELVLRDSQANAPWQRLKRNLLLLLQLLLLTALVFALARPALPAPGVASDSVIVLLDASASMNAQDIPPSRFEAARSAVANLVDHLPLGASMTLIQAGVQPQILAVEERDRGALSRSLAAARPDRGESDWGAAFSLAAGAAGPPGQEDRTIVVVSDGGLPDEPLPPLPGDVRFIPIGQSDANLAIRALAARPSLDRLELFLSVANTGSARQQAVLSLYQDGNLVEAQEIDIPPGQNQDWILEDLRRGDSPEETSLYEARLSSVDPGGSRLDSLPLDDAAFAVYQPAGTGRVLLASTAEGGNLYLEQILAALPGLSPFRALPGEDGTVRLPDPGTSPFDLYVLDGVLPAELPQGALLLVNPPPNALFETGDVYTRTSPAEVLAGPLTRSVDWSNVNVRQARQVQVPASAEVLIQSPGGPLVFAGETGRQRFAAIAFDLHDSDLPLQVAFPILMANLVDYLLSSQPIDPAVQARGLRPGESLTIRPPVGVAEVEVVRPSGEVDRFTSGEGGLFYSYTGELGIYTIRYPGVETQPEDHFAVNLFSPLESSLRPASDLQTSAGPVAGSPLAGSGQRELWPWLTGLALALLGLEWWVYHRRQGRTAGLPKIRLHSWRDRDGKA